MIGINYWKDFRLSSSFPLDETIPSQALLQSTNEVIQDEHQGRYQPPESNEEETSTKEPKLWTQILHGCEWFTFTTNDNLIPQMKWMINYYPRVKVTQTLII